MKILLVRPKPHKDTINLQSFMICEPLELEILSSALEKTGNETVIADMIIEKKGIKRFLKGIDMVCITSYLVHVGVVKKYAAIIKKYNPAIIVVAGGVHAEVMPSDFLDENIDHIVCRDSVNAVADLAKRGEITEKYKDCYYMPDQILRKIAVDTDVCMPDRDKTARYRHKYNYVLHSRCATIKTSFGCPYKCEFCFCREITGGEFFCRNIENVIEELRTIKEKNVFIVDDNFLQNAESVEKFCTRLESDGIEKNFIVFGRADFISRNEQSIARFKECGLKSVFVGIESFKKDELDSMEKRTTVEMNIAAVKILEKYDIESYLGLICMPDWTKADFDGLIEYLNGFKLPFINLQPITSVPGTRLYEKEKEKLVLPREKYHLWDMAHLTFLPQNMSVRAYYKNILRVYFKTAASARVKKYIRKKYGFKVYLRALKGAVAITWQYLKLIIKGRVDV